MTIQKQMARYAFGDMDEQEMMTLELELEKHPDPDRLRDLKFHKSVVDSLDEEEIIDLRDKLDKIL